MADFSIVRLSPTADIPPFDCGNEDINDFLANDAVDYQEGLLAVTYLVMSEGNVLGYFCLLNDKLAYLPEDKGAWNKVNRKVRNHKRMKSYPAVNIGRLGTQKSSAHKGIGRDVIDFIKLLFIQSNKTGCRFLTVDAHKDAVGFYLKCGFSFFTDTDIEDDTRLMYYDLKPFKDMYEMSDCIEGQNL